MEVVAGVDADGGGGVGDQQAATQLRNFLWLGKAKTGVKNFGYNTDCLGDLGVLGLTSTDVDQISGKTNYVDYNELSARMQNAFNPNADMTAVGRNGQYVIVYNQANFAQSSYSEMLGTVLHEIAHLADPKKSDQDLQKALGLTQNADDTTNISKKLAGDCYKNAQP